MDLGLEGRVALVLAASRGLGRAVALELLCEGASVVLVARNTEGLASAAGDLARGAAARTRRASDRLDPVTADDADIWMSGVPDRRRTGVQDRIAWIAADVADPAAPERVVRQAVERFGRLDLLVVNSGGPAAGPFESIDDAQWDAGVESLLRAPIRFVRAALPYLRAPLVRAAGGGRIVFITSFTVKSPQSNLATSNVIRPATVGLLKTLSMELAPDGILVNGVAPGLIGTDRVRQLDVDLAARAGTSVEEVEAGHRLGIPLGRYGEPSELGAVVAFLCSARASYVTGALVAVDGGASRTLL
jgi:3-oxoacyl-[acyl-carrier protein] reductase